MIIALTCLIAILIIAFVLGVRPKDLPAPDPESPFKHLDDRKAAIYENLRDLQFEYRLGKLSDADYQTTKKDLQKELATVLEEVDKLRAQIQPGKPPAPSKPAATAARANFVCDSCGASFAQELKFCGECGKSMKVAK